MPRVINIDDIELQPRPEEFAPTGPAAERYGGRLGDIGGRIGARRLGYNITEIPPGKRAFPFHNHLVNEEMFFILEGTGELRFANAGGDERRPVRKGDFIACPPGGRDTAHQLINTGSGELRVLAVSTKDSPEICEYPDTGKFTLLGFFDHGGETPRVFMHAGREEVNVDYWEGE